VKFSLESIDNLLKANNMITIEHQYKPNSNPFSLPRPGQLNNSTLTKLKRPTQARRLEKELAPHLPTMPPLTLRGETDLSRHSYYSYLISGVPIKDYISEAETTGQLFWETLRVTVYAAFLNARHHAEVIQDSQTLILTLGRCGEIKGDPLLKHYGIAALALNTCRPSSFEDHQLFPTFTMSSNHIGKVTFQRTDIESGDTSNDLSTAIFKLHRNCGIVYQAMLELMTLLARRDWQ